MEAEEPGVMPAWIVGLETPYYSITDEQIKLSKLQGKLLGGSFTGDAQVDNWLHSIPPPAATARWRSESI